MGLGIHLALLTVLTGSALAWPATLVQAQGRSIFRPSVPASSTVRIVGTIDPTQPIDIVVTNTLSVPLGLGFHGGANLEIAPGETDKISFTAVPVNLFIYPLASEVSLRYDIAVEGNTLNTQVVRLDSIAPGDASLNVDGGGTVYIY